MRRSQEKSLVRFCWLILRELLGATRRDKQASPQAQQAHPLEGAADWRERMQKNHSVDQSIEQRVRRLTKDLGLMFERRHRAR